MKCTNLDFFISRIILDNVIKKINNFFFIIDYTDRINLNFIPLKTYDTCTVIFN